MRLRGPAAVFLLCAIAVACASQPVGDDRAAASDADGDRVTDAVDRCPATRACELGSIGPDGCLVPMSLHLEGAWFDPGAATLTAASQAGLEQAIERMTCWPAVRFEIAGHAEPCENDVASLSLRRAEVVRDYLIARGIAPERMVRTAGYADTRRIDDVRCGAAANRRTELNVAS
jgi:outer membrane protein OmpA-like peptidoglycan-associated protein